MDQSRTGAANVDDLHAVYEDYGIQPFGEAATNMARLECRLHHAGHGVERRLKTVHFQHDQTPFELNLGWLVDFDKPHFNGRNALLQEQERGPKFTSPGWTYQATNPSRRLIPGNNQRCTKDIGYVTSAMWSPAAKANIALAMIKTERPEGDIWAEVFTTRKSYASTAKSSVAGHEETILDPAPGTRRRPAGVLTGSE